MPCGKVHPSVLIDDRRLERFGKLDKMIDAGLRPGSTIHNDHWIVGLHQESSCLGDCARIALRRRRQRQLRYARIGPFADRVFLEFAIYHQQHRPHEASHRDLIGAHGGLGEVRQRNRLIVPFRVVADHRCGILDAVVPFSISGVPHRGVQGVADDDINRHAVAICVVDRHGGVLQSDRALSEHAQRLALNLGIAVAHGDRRLFMTTGDELGFRLPAVIDH